VKAIGLVKTASKLRWKGESYRASQNCLKLARKVKTIGLEETASKLDRK